MTNILLGALVAFAMTAAIECFLLLGRVQLLFDHAELILRALHTLLREVPTKSAERTIAAIDEKPRPWFQTLRRLAELRDRLDQVTPRFTAHTWGPEPVEDTEPAEDIDVDLARWADDGGTIAPEPVKVALTADPLPGLDAHTEVETAVDEDQTPTVTFPPVPVTEPVERIEIAGGLRLPPEDHEPPELLGDETPPIVDEVDLQLVRWGLRTAEGHRP